jgi:chromosome segregation ATPase
VLASIERSRALLARSTERLDRQAAGLKRTAEDRERQQAEINRESAESERHLLSGLPDPSNAVERAKDFRTRARNAVEALASAHEEIASINEQLAARLPDRRDEYERSAEQARAAAREARDVLPALTD